MNNSAQLPVPSFFDPEKVGEIYRVPYEQRAVEAREWTNVHNVQPAVDDKPTICLLLVDCQNTFCIPGFELFVQGRSGRAAVDDNVRLCRFIYENLNVITEIAPTMDTHQAAQIFHAAFWVNEKGEHPAPMTTITEEDLNSGVWMIDPAVRKEFAGEFSGDADEYALHYVRRLTDKGKYSLTIWPYHAMLGGIGHALVSAVEEAIFFHSIARNTQGRFQIKGDNVLTEHYSVLSPEVLEDQNGIAIGQKNDDLIEKLLKFDAVFIAGQAKSHCVAWTIEDLLAEITVREQGLARKVYLLQDCASPVVVPGVVDFTDEADAAFARFGAAGMNLVETKDFPRIYAELT